MDTYHRQLSFLTCEKEKVTGRHTNMTVEAKYEQQQGVFYL